MTDAERRIKELKRDIKKLRKMLKDGGLNRSTLHNVRFNAREQKRRYDMALELSNKEDELEELEDLKRKEGKRLKIICNRCNKEYPITELSNLDFARIINVKTGKSLESDEKGIYRIMDIMSLPCHRDTHWIFSK